MKKTITETKTVIINTRNDDEFVEKCKLFNENDEFIGWELTRENGTTKDVSESTFKRWYKETEITVETEIEIAESIVEKPVAETKHQKAALNNIRHAYSWNIGSYENAVQDGEIEAMPPIGEMFSLVYTECMNSLYTYDCAGGAAPLCMRFAGKAFVKQYIAHLFSVDGYDVPEELYRVKQNAKRSSSDSHNTLRKDTADKTVTVYAFSGMLIGTFAVEAEDEESISVKDRKNRLLQFSKQNGRQINALKPQFANYIK